eukprot:RCo012604
MVFPLPTELNPANSSPSGSPSGAAASRSHRSSFQPYIRPKEPAVRGAGTLAPSSALDSLLERGLAEARRERSLSLPSRVPAARAPAGPDSPLPTRSASSRISTREDSAAPTFPQPLRAYVSQRVATSRRAPSAQKPPASQSPAARRSRSVPLQPPSPASRSTTKVDPRQPLPLRSHSASLVPTTSSPQRFFHGGRQPSPVVVTSLPCISCGSSVKLDVSGRASECSPDTTASPRQAAGYYVPPLEASSFARRAPHLASSSAPTRSQYTDWSAPGSAVGSLDPALRTRYQDEYANFQRVLRMKKKLEQEAFFDRQDELQMKRLLRQNDPIIIVSEQQQYSFAPTTLPAPSARRASAAPVWDDLYRQGMTSKQSQKSRREALAKRKEEEEVAERSQNCTFVPKVSAAAQRVRRAGSGDVVSRLYDDRLQRQTKLEKAVTMQASKASRVCTFKPTVTARRTRSRPPMTAQELSNRLFQDAEKKSGRLQIAQQTHLEKEKARIEKERIRLLSPGGVPTSGVAARHKRTTPKRQEKPATPSPPPRSSPPDARPRAPSSSHGGTARSASPSSRAISRQSNATASTSTHKRSQSPVRTELRIHDSSREESDSDHERGDKSTLSTSRSDEGDHIGAAASREGDQRERSTQRSVSSDDRSPSPIGVPGSEGSPSFTELRRVAASIAGPKPLSGDYPPPPLSSHHSSTFTGPSASQTRPTTITVYQG